MTVPSVSLVIAANAVSPHALPVGGALEVIAVGEKVPQLEPSAAAIAVRHVPSNAPAGQRGNIGISLASGDWVIVLNGREELAGNWLHDLHRTLAQGTACAHRFVPAEGGPPLLAVWRQAFAYGALHGQIDDASDAMEHWLIDIFPAHQHRVLPREGSATHRVGWLDAGTMPSKPTPSLHRAAEQADSAYNSRRFWEIGESAWVKWEAYQPDEPEIHALVERSKPRRVLELGCGGGRNGRYFAAAEGYAGLDISYSLLERACDRQASNSVGLVCGDAVQLPFADAAFDLVFAVSTLQHVVDERIAACIKDILRVTRRYIGLIEFTAEISEHGTWFAQPHMFRHDYPILLGPYADLVMRSPTGLQIQPALKEMFLFEKR